METTDTTVDAHFERYKEENPLGYTKLELAKKKKMILDIERDYPNLPRAWIEMVVDFEKITPPEEMERIINEGLFEYEGKFTAKKSSVNSKEDGTSH